MRASTLSCALMIALTSAISLSNAQPGKSTVAQGTRPSDAAKPDCNGASCPSEIAKHAIALNAACKAGACPGPTGPVIPGKNGALILTADMQAQLARGLALVASVHGVSPDQLYQMHKQEAAKLSQAASAKP